jgi:hypothetical protein
MRKRKTIMEGYKLYKTKEFIRKNEKGGLDFDRSLTMIRELVKAASHHKDHNILVDIRNTETKLNFVELLTVTLEFAKYEDVFQNKIVFLIPNEEERIKRAEYVKKSLVGVMGFQLEYFTDYEKAIEWLSTIKEYEG